jgi:hypothetical protein
MAPLFALLQNPSVTVTMYLAGLYSLPTDGSNNGTVLPGAYVPMKCNTGYVLATGQLNITCIGDAWTTFPTCVLNTSGGSVTTTPMSTSNGSPCVVDPTSTFNLTNGYVLSISLSYTSNTAATGN